MTKRKNCLLYFASTLSSICCKTLVYCSVCPPLQDLNNIDKSKISNYGMTWFYGMICPIKGQFMFAQLLFNHQVYFTDQLSYPFTKPILFDVVLFIHPHLVQLPNWMKLQHSSKSWKDYFPHKWKFREKYLICVHVFMCMILLILIVLGTNLVMHNK